MPYNFLARRGKPFFSSLLSPTFRIPEETQRYQ